MSQSRKMSFVEVCLSTVIGFVVSMITTAAVFPLFDLHATIGDNIGITTIFTFVSIVRGYCVRRLFARMR
jgi:hypothetical protein